MTSKRAKTPSVAETLAQESCTQALERSRKRQAARKRGKMSPSSKTKMKAFIEAPGRSGAFDLDLSDSWSPTKNKNYLFALCSKYGIKNTCVEQNIGERRCVVLAHDFIVRGDEHFPNRRALWEFVNFLFEHWEEFCTHYPKAVEVGFHPAYWAKAWTTLKKFRENYEAPNQAALDLLKRTDELFN